MGETPPPLPSPGGSGSQLAFYRRALLKISGESLKGVSGSGIDADAVQYLASQVGEAHALGVELAIVIGGGNIWRGEAAEKRGMERSTADYAGMLAYRYQCAGFAGRSGKAGRRHPYSECTPDAGGG